METNAVKEDKEPKLFGLIPIILLVAGLIIGMIVLKIFLAKLL
jgi:hypothetical protein